MNPEARKKGGFMFSKMGRPAGGAGMNKPGKKQGKKAFFAEGGSTTFAEEFKKARAKGAGTKFMWKGKEIAAYREGEEPKSWKKKDATPKPASQQASTPFGVSFEKARAEGKSTFDYAGDKAMGYGSDKEKHKPGKYTTKLKMAEGGSVESKKMMKREVAFMKNKGAPKSMVKHEMAEAKGMKKGGMACGGKMKYAEGGAVKKPYKPSAGDLNEKSGGDQEMEMRELMRKKAKPATPAPKPKMYARGGGIESKGKGAGTMIKMASGGSVSSRADGVAVKGKTNCKIC